MVEACFGTMMAEALMKYETIDSDQIDDIMAGAKPREPGSTPPSSGQGTGKRDDAAGESPIGGPAEEH